MKAFIASSIWVYKRIFFGPNQSINTPDIGENNTDGKPFKNAINPMKPAALFSEKRLTATHPRRVVSNHEPISDILCAVQKFLKYLFFSARYGFMYFDTKNTSYSFLKLYFVVRTNCSIRMSEFKFLIYKKSMIMGKINILTTDNEHK